MNAQPLTDQQRTILLDRLFQRISKLDDQRLVQLEAQMQSNAATVTLPVTAPLPAAPAKPIKAAPRPTPDQNSRRLFLLSLMAGSVLAVGAGGAAAVALSDERIRTLLRQEGWLPTLTPTASPTATPIPSATPIPTLPAETVSQINRLQGQVSTLQGQLNTLTGERDGLRKQLADAQTTLSGLRTQYDGLQGLVELYKQLDATNLDDAVRTALTALGSPLAALDTVRKSLDGGLVVGARIFQTMEGQMPLIAAGLDWLSTQVDNLSLELAKFRTALQIAASTPLATAVTDFVNGVLNILPFGAGQNIRATLTAMAEIVNRVPELVNNANTRLLQPARAWVSVSKQGGLNALLFTPIREQLFNPAQQVVANVQNLNSVYNSNFVQPAQTVLQQRTKIRADIAKKSGVATS